MLQQWCECDMEGSAYASGRVPVMLLFLTLSIVTEANELQASGRVPAVLTSPVTSHFCHSISMSSALCRKATH